MSETKNLKDNVSPLASIDLLGAARYFKIGDSVTDGSKIGIVESIHENLVAVDWGMWTQNVHYTDLELSD